MKAFSLVLILFAAITMHSSTSLVNKLRTRISSTMYRKQSQLLRCIASNTNTNDIDDAAPIPTPIPIPIPIPKEKRERTKTTPDLSWGVRAVGVALTPYAEKFGVPRQATIKKKMSGSSDSGSSDSGSGSSPFRHVVVVVVVVVVVEVVVVVVVVVL